MTADRAPLWPILIPSKGRAAIALTPRSLDAYGVPYRLIVEEQEREEYARHFPEDRLVTLDPNYKRDYELCDDLGLSKSTGPGPARNFAWDLTVAEGADWHWVMDDNIRCFRYRATGLRHEVTDGTGIRAMEEFCLRYRNIAMAGPQYEMFNPPANDLPPYITGTRIYSCNLIRNSLSMRWRCRYNEDTDLSLRMLKAGWATVQFNVFMQHKVGTQEMPGGNTADFYSVEGTLAKSKMLVRMHPDVARLAWRFGRVHHYVDYRRWRGQPLIPEEGLGPPEKRPLRVASGPPRSLRFYSDEQRAALLDK